MSDRQEANPSIPKLKRKTKTYENPTVHRTSYKGAPSEDKSGESGAINNSIIEKRTYKGMDINQLDEQYQEVGVGRRPTHGLNKSLTQSQGAINSSTGPPLGVFGRGEGRNTSSFHTFDNNQGDTSGEFGGNRRGRESRSVDARDMQDFIDQSLDR